MYSYIALTWNPDNDKDIVPDSGGSATSLQQQLRSLPGFQIVLSVPGLFIVQRSGLHSACEACPLADHRGIILGTVFSWPAADETPARHLSIDCAETAMIEESGGNRLISRFWGRYVAFIRNSQTNRFIAIRDPSGMLPCFRMLHGGVQIWFSRLEDLQPLALPRPAINWRYVEGHAATGVTRSHETGLVGVTEVQPGESWATGSEAIERTILWNPAIICNAHVVEDAAVAAERLRSVTKACIDAWASVYPGILHTLSGGLDSSIVAVLLGQTPTRTPVTCVNYFTPEAEGDERQFARLAAQRAGFELIEHRRTPRTVDLSTVVNISSTPNPWSYDYYIEHADYELQLAHDRRAAAIFTGGGGDGIFYRAEAGYSVSDYVQRHGVTRRLLSVALNAARMEGKSLISMLWGTFGDRKHGSRHEWAIEYAKQQSLLSEKTLASHAEHVNSHFEGADRCDVPMGKWWQILTTSIPPPFYDQFNSPLAVEQVSPLVSQPIVELCLKVPTYVLVENGWDRAIARRAFAADLPAAIVNRRGKGAIQNHARTIFNANLRFLREFMLDGEMARRGLLNREKLERCLSASQSLAGNEFSQLQDHLSTEAWIRRAGYTAA